MRKHRRKKSYRPIAIAVVAAGAVGIPSAAMACLGSPEDAGSRPSAHWETVSSAHHWKTPSSAHHWTAGPRGQKPTASAPTSPAASAGASAAPAPTATPASADTARVLALVNSERGKVGCSPLTVNAKLTKAAQDHSKDMADHRNMSHTGSDGSLPGDRITRAGYTWSAYGENVAYGYSTPESVMNAWMTSPGHKRNILDCTYKEIGIGLAQPGHYWTQDFGTAR
ncbi:CAP domain-containing protein [Streptomyces sp. NPDC051286]|uniref:CAP domain-containing protein n=1 Tax=Streptomyces sp. NPDC051286 TaxID=3365647 RepID=UPI0037A04BD6